MKLDLENIKVVFDYSDGEIADVKRCLETLYQTPEGTCPLDREFGLDLSLFVGAPMNDMVKNMFAVEIMEKTDRYEPRAKIKNINYQLDVNGHMAVEVIITNV